MKIKEPRHGTAVLRYLVIVLLLVALPGLSVSALATAIRASAICRDSALR